jgi:hypothetical protein
MISFAFVDATKFLNDDYVLACALDDGQVLFLNGYQDASPTRVNTDLQSKPFASSNAFASHAILLRTDIKIDWSSPDEILAVGGHRRINDSSYLNQIIFYTRRGDFLHRVHIPQTVRKHTRCRS